MKKVDFENSIGNLVSTTYWKMKNYFTTSIAKNDINVTPEQWNLMNIISENPGITQTELAIKGNKDKTNVTRILDVLDKNGYMTRSTDRSDRRIFRINLTDNGKEVLGRINPIAYEVLNGCTEGFTEQEVEQLRELLKRICQNTDI